MADHTTDAGALSYGGLIGLNTDNAAPPTQAYIGVDDRLQIFVASSVATPFVIVFARVLLPDSTIVPNQWLVSASNGRQGQNFYFSIAEGFLLSLTVSQGNALGPGQTFCRVSLIRGTQAVNTVSQVLMAGYVTGTNNLSWPLSTIASSTDGRGNIRSITGTTPLAGQQITESVPFFALWRLVSFKFALATSAAAGSRNVGLLIDDGTNVLVFTSLPAASNVAPSNGTTAFFMDNINFTFTPTQANMANIPTQFFLQPGWRIRSSIQPFDVADQLSVVQYVVEEWITG